MRNLPEIVVEFSEEKVLNPHQRQFLEDTKRVKDKLEQMNKNGKGRKWLKPFEYWTLIIPDGFGSASNLHMRKKDDDFDPDEMDEHDSFYHTTKSLLTLFQIMGVMPIMRNPTG